MSKSASSKRDMNVDVELEKLKSELAAQEFAFASDRNRQQDDLNLTDNESAIGDTQLPLIKDTQVADATEMKQLRLMQLFVSGKNLLNLDVGRDKSDTFCILKMKWQRDQIEWLEVDQTEVQFDSLDPNWEHRFQVVFNLGQVLLLRFEVWDQDTSGKKELIGYIETSLADLLKQKETIANPLKGPHDTAMGFLSVTVQESMEAQYNVSIKCAVTNLPQMHNMFECNFATTFYLELWKGETDK
jgi:hypothetical protein